MSECVVRMEMPKACWSCGLRFVCKAANDFLTTKEAGCSVLKVGMEGCLIVCQLPEGHGRLVDIDRKFLRVANNGHGMSWNWRGSIADMIDKDNMRGVEVIVPAEEDANADK